MRESTGTDGVSERESTHPPVFVINPRADNGATARRFERARRDLVRALGTFRIVVTEDIGHATLLTRQALRDGADVIVSVGGDGTNNEVLNGFFDESFAPVRPGARLGLLGGGTGSDFRRALGWSRGIDGDIVRLQRGRVRQVDAGLAHFTTPGGAPASRFFLNIASFGLSGAVTDVVNRSSKALGAKVSYIAGTLRAFADHQPPRVRIGIDEGTGGEHRICVVAVANGRYFGGGMCIAPDAVPDDGRFDMVRVDDAGRGYWLRHAARVYAGTHRELDTVAIERGRVLWAEALEDTPVLIDLDGEQPGRLPARFEIRPGALSLLD